MPQACIDVTALTLLSLHNLSTSFSAASKRNTVAHKRIHQISALFDERTNLTFRLKVAYEFRMSSRFVICVVWNNYNVGRLHSCL